MIDSRVEPTSCVLRCWIARNLGLGTFDCSAEMVNRHNNALSRLPPAVPILSGSSVDISSRIATMLRIVPGELFRRELRLRLCRQRFQPKLPHNSFYNTTHDVWRTCELCGTKARSMKKCSGCRLAHYCDASCQKSHWNCHKGCCCPDAALPLGRRYISYLTYKRDTSGHDSVN